MALTQRKPRPLTRDVASFRDDRLFIVACDDTYAPKQYFGFFQIPRVHVHVVATEDGTSAAEHVLERLRNIDHEKDDELWLLLDTDHYAAGGHIKSFRAAIVAAKQQGINIALSKPCFELWLLLHHEEESAVRLLPDCGALSDVLRAKLGQYNKTNLKPEHYPVASVKEAWVRARSLDETVQGGDIPSDNTTRVYKLWAAIAAKALPSQLPPELKSLLPCALWRSMSPTGWQRSPASVHALLVNHIPDAKPPIVTPLRRSRVSATASAGVIVRVGAVGRSVSARVSSARVTTSSGE